MTAQSQSKAETASYFAIPRSSSSPESHKLLVEKYKAFRLLSLQLSPECFGSTYAREAAFPPETWISRITNPGATNVVAVSGLAHGEAEPLLAGEWLASLTLIGPLEPSKALDMFKAQTSVDPSLLQFGNISDGGSRWHFLLNAMYVVPAARGWGIGRGILDFAKEIARELGRGDPVRIMLVVDYDNEDARRTYERAGFATVHRYWFDDNRVGRESRTEAAVMRLDL
jgi:GNAT superfamily N-acetyltransferase